MAAADWESVGGARTPESERFAVELVGDVGVTQRTESGSNKRERSALMILNLIPLVMPRGRQRVDVDVRYTGRQRVAVDVRYTDKSESREEDQAADPGLTSSVSLSKTFTFPLYKPAGLYPQCPHTLTTWSHAHRRLPCTFHAFTFTPSSSSLDPWSQHLPLLENEHVPMRAPSENAAEAHDNLPR